MSSHAATPSLRRSLAASLRRPAGRHRATPARHRAVRTRRPLARHARVVLSTLPILLAGVLTILALATPQQAATAAVRTDVVQPAVRLQWVPAEVLPPADRIEEDDPRWDCATMGNGRCSNPALDAAIPAGGDAVTDVRTDSRFPDVRFHYVVVTDAAGAPVRSYTANAWADLLGVERAVSTATDRY